MKRSIESVLSGCDLEPHEQSLLEDYARYLMSTLPEADTKAVFLPEMLGQRATKTELNSVLSSLEQKRKLVSHPVAAMLASVAGTNKSQRDKHECLKAWMFLACVSVEGNENAVESACCRVRRLATAEDRWLLRLVLRCAVETPSALIHDLASRKRELVPKDELKLDAPGYVKTDNLPIKLAAKIRKIEAIECLLKDYWYGRPDRTQGSYSDGDSTYRPPPVEPATHASTASENTFEPELQARIIADKPRQPGLHIDDDEYEYGQLLDADIATKPEHAADRKKGARDRQAIASSIEMRATHAACHWDCLTPNEVSRALHATYFAAVDGCLPSLFIALGFFFGRHPSELARYEKNVYQGTRPDTPQWKVLKNRIDLVRHENNPEFNMSWEQRELIDRPYNYLVLPTPAGLSTPLRAALKSIWSGEVDLSNLDRRIADHNSRLNKNFNLRLTERRIALELHRFLFRAGESDVVTNRIRGTSARGNYKGHYDYSNQGFLQERFERYCRVLRDRIGRGEDWVEARHKTAPLGSHLGIHPKAISYYFSEQRSRLNAILNAASPPVETHNAFAMYVYQLLSLATGHRPVRVPFETIRDFDLVSRELYLCDKVQPRSNEGRTVVLPDVAYQQLLCYLQHLKALRSATRRTDLFVSRTAVNAVEGTGPILFFIQRYRNRFSPVDLSPNALTPRLREDWPFEKNWHRHFLRTALVPVASHETVDAFLGHHDDSPAGFSRYSRLSYSKLRDLADSVDKCLAGLGIEAIEGLR